MRAGLAGISWRNSHVLSSRLAVPATVSCPDSPRSNRCSGDASSTRSSGSCTAGSTSVGGCRRSSSWCRWLNLGVASGGGSLFVIYSRQACRASKWSWSAFAGTTPWRQASTQYVRIWAGAIASIAAFSCRDSPYAMLLQPLHRVLLSSYLGSAFAWSAAALAGAPSTSSVIALSSFVWVSSASSRRLIPLSSRAPAP